VTDAKERLMPKTERRTDTAARGLLMAETIAAAACGDLDPHGVPVSAKEAPTRASGVCPPFQLRDEAGNVIDPVKGENDTVPYSPRQTCGASGCHDYGKVTEGFHFTQGRGEQVPARSIGR
jgi:hypothetical protein